MPKPTDPQPNDHKFGTFGGVFTPCTLTILGVIMFLRFGHVVGNAGLWHALAIVLLAKAITTLTGLSLSAISTNTKVRGGGAYYLISRSLGVELGGAIGVVFYLAQAASVAMYVIGFTEALYAVVPGLDVDPRIVASVVNAVVFVAAYIGASWAIKIQYVILGVLALSVGAFFAGAVEAFDTSVLRANLAPSYQPGQGFFTMFALFFPAATGIMAGANMSGDLRDPARSIPLGTLSAIAVTGVIYVGMAVMLLAARPSQDLVGNYQVVSDIAVSPLLITAGVLCATLSSALGSMVGAPRVLQALARDRVFHVLRGFGAGAGKTSEPRRAAMLTFVIAEGGVMLGDLDAIAPIITMFFMITYGAINLATFYESITQNPSYRPTFRFSHWSTELVGALGCLAAMLLISPLWAMISIVVMVGLLYYISRKEIIATFGDVQGGAAFKSARLNLLRLEQARYHPKNWRPSILAFGGASTNRAPLAIHGHWLSGGRGVLVLAQVVVGDIDQQFERRSRQEEVLRTFIKKQELEAFPAVVVAPTLNAGIDSLLQCGGVGAFRPNVALFGWSEDRERLADFAASLRRAAGLRRSVVVLKTERQVEDPWVAPRGTIDVWWRGQDNGPLMLLLAHLMAQSPEWRTRPLRVLRMIALEAGVVEATAHLEELCLEARIEATPIVIVSEDLRKSLWQESARAAVVFLGFRPPEEGAEEPFADWLERTTVGLGTVIVVHSAGDVCLEA